MKSDYDIALEAQAAAAIKANPKFSGARMSETAWNVACECLAGAIDNADKNGQETYKTWYDGMSVIDIYSESCEHTSRLREAGWKAASKAIELGLETLISEAATTETELVAICAKSGTVMYVGANIDAINKAHTEIAGYMGRFVEAGYDEAEDFLVYSVPAADAAEMDGSTDIDFDAEYGEPVRYRLRG